MSIYLLNISVDASDPNPDYIPEDLTFNDQESIIEIFVEKVLGFEDAINEYDDRDAEDHNSKNSTKIDLLAQFLVNYCNVQLIIEAEKQKLPDVKTNLTNGFLQLDTPPPQL